MIKWLAASARASLSLQHADTRLPFSIIVEMKSPVIRNAPSVVGGAFGIIVDIDISIMLNVGGLVGSVFS